MNSEELVALARKAETVAKLIYEGNIAEGQKTLGEVVNGANSAYLYYIQRENELLKEGIELPKDILLQQIGNLMDAIDNKDMLALADTLQYELREGILYLSELSVAGS